MRFVRCDRLVPRGVLRFVRCDRLVPRGVLRFVRGYRDALGSTLRPFRRGGGKRAHLIKQGDQGKW
ncbi:hypothetical protein GCM10020001_033760 [Nonomuraea salmonea]